MAHLNIGKMVFFKIFFEDVSTNQVRQCVYILKTSEQNAETNEPFIVWFPKPPRKASGRGLWGRKEGGGGRRDRLSRETFCPIGHHVPSIFSRHSHSCATPEVLMSSFCGFLSFSWTAPVPSIKDNNKTSGNSCLSPQNAAFIESGMEDGVHPTRAVTQG